jgi:hypothetical protein
LPTVRNLRLDLLGETADGGLAHVELQSGNDAAMPLRMAVIDIRTLGGDRLLESAGVGDNVIAILAGLRDHAARKIVERIASLVIREHRKGAKKAN